MSTFNLVFLRSVSGCIGHSSTRVAFSVLQNAWHGLFNLNWTGCRRTRCLFLCEPQSLCGITANRVVWILARLQRFFVFEFGSFALEVSLAPSPSALLSELPSASNRTVHVSKPGIIGLKGLVVLILEFNLIRINVVRRTLPPRAIARHTCVLRQSDDVRIVVRSDHPTRNLGYVSSFVCYALKLGPGIQPHCSVLCHPCASWGAWFILIVPPPLRQIIALLKKIQNPFSMPHRPLRHKFDQR